MMQTEATGGGPLVPAAAAGRVPGTTDSPIHEERHLALVILVLQVAECDDDHRKRVYDLYLDNTRFINNWDC